MDTEQNILDSIHKKKGKKNIIILVLIILGLLGYLVYDKVIKNSTTEKNNEKEDNNTTEKQNNQLEEEKGYTNLNLELKNVLTFNISEVVGAGEKLVAVTKDGKEILIADLYEYNGEVRYDFYNDKIYLYMQKYIAGKQENGIVTVQPVHNTYLAYIDLNKGNGNYKVNIITEINNDNWPESIAATSDELYIVAADMAVKKYSLTDNKLEDTNILGKDMMVRLYSTKDGSDYLVYNIGWDLYLLNITTNESKLIEDKGKLSFLYNSKIVYYKYATTGYSKLIYYEYDIKTGPKKILSPEVSYPIASIYAENIMPYNDGYIYFTVTNVMSYNNGDYKELFDYTEAGYAYTISKSGRVSEDVIYLGFSTILVDPNNSKTRTINLKDKSVEAAFLNYEYMYTKYYEQK